jgi:hypothetical protein
LSTSGELDLDGEDLVDSAGGTLPDFSKSTSEAGLCFAGTNTGAFASSFDAAGTAGEGGKGVNDGKGLLDVGD